MKKLVYTVAAAALFFATQNATAQTEATPTEESTEAVAPTQDYAAIEVSEVPEAVTASVAKDFEGAAISEVHKDGQGNYKLVLTMGEESKTVYANESGEWIEPNE